MKMSSLRRKREDGVITEEKERSQCHNYGEREMTVSSLRRKREDSVITEEKERRR
ncbi:hypothetical protein Bpfe_000426, partial [Biomphalaria pfeifferi]